MAHRKWPYICIALSQQCGVADTVKVSTNQDIQHEGGATVLPGSVWARSHALGSGPGPTRALPDVSSQGSERLGRAGPV